MTAQRTLLTWGVIWLLVSMAGGMILGPQVKPTRDATRAHLVNAFEHLSEQDSSAAMEELRQGLDLDITFGHLVAIHSHMACMAFTALLIGLLAPFLGLSNGWKSALAWALIAGSIIHEVGVFAEDYHLAAGISLAATGASLITLSVVTAFVGIVRFVGPARS